MSEFNIISISHLYKLILAEEKKGFIFGIHKDTFYEPNLNVPYKVKRYGQILETPIGVAAGPHTQLAQNIIAAWLTGARYIELKTVQVLDELKISRPCIDMQDEGYNCEWSQELKIQESYDQYLNAWIIIHILKDKFGWNTEERGFIFNMSVGYNMEGILSDKVQWFFNKMKDCSIEKKQKIQELAPLYPRIYEIDIPDCISDNVTLSTMHGCPPDEIEKIAAYLISEKKLHTTIKLNPTLLGPDKLRDILNNKLGWEIIVPDEAFAHDLKYPDAIRLIKNLIVLAEKTGVEFGLKLTNTLESLNIRNVLPENEKMNYMSGRALHPISINLAALLQKEFEGHLDISFAGGADVFNINDIIACGLKPVTVCSDILKPGGYGRLSQYLQALFDEFKYYDASSIDEYINNKLNNKNKDVKVNALNNLLKYAESVINSDMYRYEPALSPNIKSVRKLEWFDCIAAPCVHGCPTNQDIPDYLYYAGKGLYDEALEVILKKNPFPSVLGAVCTHFCQYKCTRINYDNPILIRDIKRYIVENATKEPLLTKSPDNGLKVAIIGAGPSGLSCAFFLILEGFKVDVYETKDSPGGMIADAIPTFRLQTNALKKDIDRISSLGVNFYWNYKITSNEFEKIQKEYDYIYIAVGAQKNRKLNIEGEELEGVIDPLEFLSAVKKGKNIKLGSKIAVIGGGNTAVDVARTAKRLVGGKGEVTLLYRRTRLEMPAGYEEIKDLIEENIIIKELVAPERISGENGKVKQMVLSMMKIEGVDSQGRPKPVKIPNSEITLDFDAIIPALGQEVDINFIDISSLKPDFKTYRTAINNIFIGGDAMRGAATIVNAVADGRKVAEIIMLQARIENKFKYFPLLKNRDISQHMLMRSRRIKGIQHNNRHNKLDFDIILKSFNPNQVKEEASRCLFCDEFCNICVTVCPNRANYSYSVKPQQYQLQKLIRNTNGEMVAYEDTVFVVKQNYQVINIGDFCNECGNCNTFCPTEGAPWRDKPKMFLTIGSFKNAKEGFFINKIRNERIVLIYKKNDEIKTLTKFNDGKYTYETSFFEIELNEKFRVEKCKSKTPCVKQVFLTFAAEMKIILDNVQDLYTEILN